VDVNTLNGPGGEEVLAAQLEKVGQQIYTQIFVKFIQIFVKFEIHKFWIIKTTK